MTSKKSAAERIADVRKCYANSPEPVGHLSDLELVFRELDAAITSERSVQGRYDRMLQEQNRHERDVRTSARRAAEDARTEWTETHMRALIQRSEYPFRTLAYRAQQISAKVGKEQLDGLHQAARDVAEELKQPVQSDELKVAEHWRAEVWRLRDYITTAGRALHADFGAAGVGCHCRGCELIRGMDDIEAEPSVKVGEVT